MDALKRFTPNWFTVGMGTGITALDAYILPGAPAWLRDAATVLWLVNLGAVTVFFVLFATRAIVDRRGVIKVLHDPVQSMFLGAIPMALTTVVNGFLDMGAPLFGAAAIRIGYDLWVVNVLLAVASGVVVPYLMFLSHDHRLERMTAIWLMPVVPAEVVAATAGILIPHFGLAAGQTLAVIGMVLWALSVPIAFLILGTLFLRLTLHKLPPKEMAITTWISLGTLGTGVMGLISLGKSLPLLFGAVGSGMDGGAVLGAVILWGFGLWWLVMSILTTVHYVRRGLPFNLGWWGLTFPLGVFSGGTDLLYAQLHVPLIGFLALVFFVMLVSFWGIVASRTLLGLVGPRVPRIAPAEAD
ncbi:MAG: TDT family transporter [Thermaerobacter sp.]|nr:TDT family transporter [Thermaerobacter sp.]